MNQKEQNFKKALIEFLKTQNIILTSLDCYDGEDNFSGTDYYFEGKDVYINVSKLID